ncbi:MAG: hypothetical protein HC904_03795 [Blastochloris sp.]|nr:hypothetical protein [Blastochloris sp.]
MAFNLFCGHLHLFLTTTLFLSIAALALAIWEKRWGLLLRWALAYFCIALALLPWFLSSLDAVASSPRQQEINTDDPQGLSLSFILQIASLFAGPIFSRWDMGPQIFELKRGYSITLAYSASSILLMTLLFVQAWRFRWIWAIFPALSLFFG